jgi:hypothetical protein
MESRERDSAGIATWIPFPRIVATAPMLAGNDKEGRFALSVLMVSLLIPSLSRDEP